jgi:hypothetical protein
MLPISETRHVPRRPDAECPLSLGVSAIAGNHNSAATLNDDEANDLAHRPPALPSHIAGGPGSCRSYILAISTYVRYVLGMGRQRTGWWWNGRWGRLARRDIKIFTDGQSWSVEDLQGGVEGRLRAVDGLTDERARTMAEDLMAGGDGWRDMT